MSDTIFGFENNYFSFLFEIYITNKETWLNKRITHNNYYPFCLTDDLLVELSLEEVLKAEDHGDRHDALNLRLLLQGRQPGLSSVVAISLVDVVVGQLLVSKSRLKAKQHQ